jgi:hypothetical protein
MMAIPATAAVLAAATMSTTTTTTIQSIFLFVRNIPFARSWF